MSVSSLAMDRSRAGVYVALCFAGSLGVASRATADESPQKSACLSAYSEAQELRIQGSLLKARERLLVCSQAGCPGPLANDCTGWLAEVDSSLPSAVFAVSDELGHDISDARVSANDRSISERTDGRAILLDPGSYIFSFEAPGYLGAHRTLTMRQSEKDRIVRVQLKRATSEAPSVAPTAQPPPQDAEPQPGSVPLATYVLGGVALAGVGTFAYFGLTGLQKKHDAESCSSDCRGLIDEGKRNYAIADVGLGVAVLAASSALLVFLLRDDVLPAAHSGIDLRLRPVLTPQRASLSVLGRF